MKDEAGEQEGRRTAEGEAPSGTSAAAKGVPAGLPRALAAPTP